MLGEFGIFSVLSRCNKNLKRRTDQRYSPWTEQCSSPQMDQCYSPMLQTSFIQKVKENTSSRSEGVATQKMQREACAKFFGSSFYMCLFFFFSPPPGSALCKLDQSRVLFVLPQVLTPVLRLSFVLFSQAFPFLVFQPPSFFTPFSYSKCLT